MRDPWKARLLDILDFARNQIDDFAILDEETQIAYSTMVEALGRECMYDEVLTDMSEAGEERPETWAYCTCGRDRPPGAPVRPVRPAWDIRLS